MFTITKRVFLLFSGFAFATHISATPVDLSTWTAEGGSSNWNVQTGNDSVLQTVNGAPTVFFDPNATSSQGKALSGEIKVTTTLDDDFIGFVLGYNSGEILSETADFFLIDWKQGNQGNASRGLSISHVTNGKGDYWEHTDGVSEILRAENLGDTGWSDKTSYQFDLVFTDSLIEVIVNQITEISIRPDDVPGLNAFSDGAFGFYNYSQANVLYSAITETDCSVTPNDPACGSSGGDQPPTSSVPEPGTLALLSLGLLGTGIFRKRSRA
jgi:Thrombospondin C-terminal region/PEP-CTERM motif